MVRAEDIRSGAERLAEAILDYGELVASPEASIHDVEQSWNLVRESYEDFASITFSGIELDLPKLPPFSPRKNPVVWLDVGYAVEILDHQRLAKTVLDRTENLEYDDIETLTSDPVALIDYLEHLDGWDNTKYGPSVLRPITETRGIRKLTKYEAMELGKRIDAGGSSHHPDDFGDPAAGQVNA